MIGRELARVSSGTLAFVFHEALQDPTPRAVDIEDPFESRAIREARKGDPTAYDYLVTKYGRRALGIAIGFVRNHSDAEDLSQEAFIRAFQTLGRFRDGQPFGPWVYRIVTNLAIDHLKKSRRRPVPAPIAEAEVSTSRADDADRAIDSRQMGARIERAIESLPDMQQVVARLSLIEEFSHREIAAMMNLAEGTVRSHLTHARSRLRAELQDLRTP